MFGWFGVFMDPKYIFEIFPHLLSLDFRSWNIPAHISQMLNKLESKFVE